MGKNIGFISTRFAGTDGVTMEAGKWAGVLRTSGHQCFWFAGQLDRNPQRSFLVPEAFFGHEQNRWINDRILGRRDRNPEVTDKIHALKSLLKARLNDFIQRFSIEMLICENCLTIPMHVPLGLALTELLAERQIPTLAHHHDFYWERTRFSVNAVSDYLRMAFPPNLSNMEHVVINSAAQEELALRTGISSIIIPNVLDFETPPVSNAIALANVRRYMGMDPDDIIFLQPTRVVQRKGIEHAIELVKRLADPRCKLVISHEAGDEGYEYAEWLKENALSQGVDLRFVQTRVADPFNEMVDHAVELSLWDIYPHADFITYPSLYEGFGNAFLEAVYFKKPLLINRYAIFVRDIEPKGFDLVAMDGYLDHRTVTKVQEVLSSPERREKMVDTNYAIALRHYSYATLRRWLNTILTNFFGIDI
jgi:glycosyltransferase involved in cell wall biosynthesis